MPLTARTITAAVLRLTCDDCGAVLEAMGVGGLALLVKTQGWETDIEIDGSTPATVIVECPKCKAAKQPDDLPSHAEWEQEQYYQTGDRLHDEGRLAELIEEDDSGT